MDSNCSPTIYVVRRGNAHLVLADDLENIPTVVQPAPILLRAEYILEEDASDERLSQCAQRLEQRGMLVRMEGGLDGPNSRTAYAYPQPEDFQISVWKELSGEPRHEALQATKYRVSMIFGYDTWQSAGGRGKPAYFVSGAPGKARLWRINGMDIEDSGRLQFSLTPVQLAGGFPNVDFSIIEDNLLRKEAESHWNELQEAFIGHRYYGAIHAAKNLVETLLSFEFEGAEPNMDGLLRKLNTRLGDKTERGVLPFNYLDYHMMQKLRLLHQRTHPGRVANLKRNVRPELALSVAADTIEVLTSVGLA